MSDEIEEAPETANDQADAAADSEPGESGSDATVSEVITDGPICVLQLVNRAEQVGQNAHIYAVYTFRILSQEGQILVEPAPRPGAPEIPVLVNVTQDTGRISLRLAPQPNRQDWRGRGPLQ